MGELHHRQLTTFDENPCKPTATEDVIRMYPELLCIGGYQEAMSKFQVPFELRDTTIVKRKA